MKRPCYPVPPGKTGPLGRYCDSVFPHFDSVFDDTFDPLPKESPCENCSLLSLLRCALS